MPKKNRFCFILSYFFFNEIVKKRVTPIFQNKEFKKWTFYFIPEVKKIINKNGSKKHKTTTEHRTERIGE